MFLKSTRCMYITLLSDMGHRVLRRQLSFALKVVLTTENTILNVYSDNFALLDFYQTWHIRCLVSNIWYNR